MKLALVEGLVVCEKKAPGFEGQKFLIIQPVDEQLKSVGRPIVANDIAQAGPGDLVFYETGREAALALPKPSDNMSDAAILGIVDGVHTL